MKIELYKNFSEDNRAVKTLEATNTAEGSLRETNVSVSDPTIVVELKEGVMTANYAVIPAFNRSYFIRDKIIVNNKLVALVLHVDVLSTYWEQFKNNDAYVSRSQNYGTPLLVDNELPIQQRSKIFQRKVFTSPFHGSSIVLTGLNTSRGGSL